MLETVASGKEYWLKLGGAGGKTNAAWVSYYAAKKKGMMETHR